MLIIVLRRRFNQRTRALVGLVYFTPQDVGIDEGTSYIHHYPISDSRNLLQLTCRGLRELPYWDCGIAWHVLGLVLR